MSIINTIEKADRDLFVFLNGLHNEFWDVVMVFFSGKWTWLPLYLFFLVLVIINFRKKWWTLLIAIALLITASDQISGLLKRGIQRYRPCHNSELADIIHIVDGCGGKFGFVSSHAANSFAIAMFLSLLFHRRYRYFTLLIFIWATAVSYSRIYLGVHYPADLACGGILGMALGYVLYFAWNRIVNRSTVLD